MKLSTLTIIFLSCTGTLFAIAIRPVRSPEQVTAQGPIIQSPEPVTSSRKRHTITVTVASPEEIKVEEGDRVAKGAVIADRTRERQALIQQRNQLQLQLEKASEPTPTPPPPPKPSYSAEKAAVEEAKEMVAYWKNVPKPEYRFKQQDLNLRFDQKTARQRQEIAQNRMEAQQKLNSAIANLQEAKSRYQRELYNYQIKRSQAKADQRQQAIDVARLQEKLDNLNQEIEQFSIIRSPYAGRVRKVKIISQNNTNLTAEVTLLVRSDEN